MYAIIEDSGTQIKASVGDELTIDLRDLADDASSITFDRILAIGGDEAKFGDPYVDGATVVAEIVRNTYTDKNTGQPVDSLQYKGEKIDVIKFKRRKGYRRKQGHRQRYLKVKVTAINA
jgi:large subunit ribosomal protein L21